MNEIEELANRYNVSEDYVVSLINSIKSKRENHDNSFLEDGNDIDFELEQELTRNLTKYKGISGLSWFYNGIN